MYFLDFGGCSTLFHLFVRHPVLVLALGLSGFLTQISSAPGIGDRSGTEGYLRGLSNKLVVENPMLASQVVQLRLRFEALDPYPTDEQVRQVLQFTDLCTDVKPSMLHRNEEAEDLSKITRANRLDAAWVLYLDTCSREGPDAADLLFRKKAFVK